MVRWPFIGLAKGALMVREKKYPFRLGGMFLGSYVWRAGIKWPQKKGPGWGFGKLILRTCGPGTWGPLGLGF
jgi:hypothetical protein